MSMSRALAAEFQHEAKSTRALLEAVPEDRMAWQPHPRSMTLSRLSGHIAELPQWAGAVVGQDDLDLGAGGYTPFQPARQEELLQAFDTNGAQLLQAVDGASDDALLQEWTLRRGETVMVQMPRIAALRGFILSHLIHHRGQLSVYLRLLDVPLPKIYGPTADFPDF